MKLKELLERLKEEGFKTRTLEDINQAIDLLGEISILERDENFDIRYNNKGEFKFETSYSNQTITKEWIEKASRVLNMLKEDFKR